MRHLPLVIFSMLAIGYGTPGLDQRKASPTEKTRWGGNTTVVMQYDEPFRKLHGTIEAPVGTALNGALVEVFDHPELVLRDYGRGNRRGQKRLAACITDETGRFSFNLPSGDYEVRASKSFDFDVTSVLIKVRKSALASKEALVVTLRLGD